MSDLSEATRSTMQGPNSNISCVETFRSLRNSSSRVTLTGEDLTVAETLSVSRSKTMVSLTESPETLDRIQRCYERVMNDVRNGVPIYGCNTGYGQRADTQTADGADNARMWAGREISEAISLVDVAVGPEFERDITRGAMLIRSNMLMRGVSGVKLDDLRLAIRLLNEDIVPIVGKYGGLGASGDLAHNCRILNTMRHHHRAEVWDSRGNRRPAKEALIKLGIEPLELDPKAGLAFCNGDNFSSSLAISLFADTLESLLGSILLGSITVEALLGTTRSYHPMLDAVRPHPGQQEVASICRYLLEGSQLAHQELLGHKPRPDGVSVQDGYSLRALSQFHAVHFEHLSSIYKTLQTNINSVSDNPLWVPPERCVDGESPWGWVSGANFLASHMADAMDRIRQMLGRVVKINDRHLARLVMPNMSNGLPANLSGPVALTQSVFKGVQIQSGMFEVYSMLLSIPVGTFFGVHEEGNQDVTSHALTSGILAQELLRITRYSMAQNMMALTKPVELRGGPERMSPRTRPAYDFVTQRIDQIDNERPLHHEIETLYGAICDGSFGDLLEHVLGGIAS